jgi:hypothetical protein
MPSLESWFIDVYRWYTHGSLGEVFKKHSDVLRPLTFVCQDYFTLVTMLLYDKHRKKKYWYDTEYKKRLKQGDTKKKYKELRDKLKRASENRAAKGIPSR